MERTQLQLRIDQLVYSGERFLPGINIIDLRGYSRKPFIEPKSPLAKYVSDEDVKSGTYEEVRPAIQARLALMEYGHDVDTILSRGNPRSKIGKWITIARWSFLEYRNKRLVEKAVKSTIKRKGGLRALMTLESANRTVDQIIEEKGMRERGCSEEEIAQFRENLVTILNN